MLSALLALALVSGCGSDTVEVDRSGASDTSGCKELLRALPRSLAGLDAREVSGSAYAAAWGDPPVVLQCGVGEPAGFDRFSQCQRVNGIDWFVPDEAFEDQSADALLTTIGRRPAVQVDVPGEHRPPDAVLVDVGKVVARHTDKVGSCQ